MTGNSAEDLPPARPAVTSDLAPPVARGLPPRPATVRATAALWWTGCVAAITGLTAALFDGGALRTRLAAIAAGEDPTAPADLIADGVQATIALVLGGVAALIAVSLVWVALLLRRRAWARWALLVTALPTLLALDVAQAVVAGDADLDRMALLAAAGAFVLALVPLLSRSARAWFRR
ncbi:hypothetical protein E4P41_19925 [Geodermatophilus sp. DF01-2]|nr:hypothetical protein E4P41_19925 [Geodermatophilus sp. DF01_2]